MLRADEIAVVRGERRIVDGITLVLGIGVTTLEGPSGCGKSTLCRALAKLVPLTAGTLTLDPPAPVYRRAVAYVPQHPAMFEGSVVANIRTGPGFAGETLDDVTVADLLSRVGLGHLVDAPRAAMLSGGERLRLALARALANRPRVLLLDEPTAALDPASADALLALVASLEATAILVVTHVAAHARALGGTHLRMDRGVLL